MQFKPVVMLILVSVSLPLQSIDIYASQTVESSPSAEISDVANVTEDAPVVENAEIVETGTASVTLQAENIVNTTAIDTSAASESASSTLESSQTLEADNFKLKATCSELNQLISSLNIEINNQVTIDQVFNLLADSGNNTVSSGQIITGDADGDTQLAQQINTTLIGSCWSYLDKSIFEETTTDLYLPYEAEILAKGQNTNSASSQPTTIEISIDNNVTNNQEINQTANTGDNSGGNISTGNSAINTQIIDTINKNILGNNWFYLEIINPYFWSGEVIGQNFDFIKTENVWYYWEWLGGEADSGEASNLDSSKNISITNQADINTQINSLVNTGGNQVLENGSNSSIETGDAASSVKIRNNINTTIIGDNWYYASINLFAPFTGNLVFERADLISEILSESLFLRPGDTLELPIRYANNGQTNAKNTRLFVEIPSELELILPENIKNINRNGNIIDFDLGNLQVGQTGIVTLKMKVRNFHQKMDLQLLAWLSSATLESNLTNNRSSLNLTLKPLNAVGGMTGTTNGTSSKDSVSETETDDLIDNQEPEITEIVSIGDFSFGLMPTLVAPVFAQEQQTVLGVNSEDNACWAKYLPETSSQAYQHSLFNEIQTWLFAVVQWLRRLVS